MQRIVVSSVSQVPALLERFRPEALLSIAAVPRLPVARPPDRHLVLNFADIDTPTARNVVHAATRAQIATIEALRVSGTLLIHCQQGQRRSPTAALILLASLFPDRAAAALADWILAAAPYVEFNQWMLSLATGDFSEIPVERRRGPPPPGAWFELNLETLRQRSGSQTG